MTSERDILEELATNDSVSDEVVFEALKTYLRDDFDENGEVIPWTDEKENEMDGVRTVIDFYRPLVVEKLRSFVELIFALDEMAELEEE